MMICQNNWLYSFPIILPRMQICFAKRVILNAAQGIYNGVCFLMLGARGNREKGEEEN